jgi:hypothetical protein
MLTSTDEATGRLNGLPSLLGSSNGNALLRRIDYNIGGEGISSIWGGEGISPEMGKGVRC